MRTYAAICPAESLPMFDGNTYARLPGGQLVAPILAGHALLVTCGSALYEFACAKAAEHKGGRVIAVESKYWPGSGEIEDAIQDLQP